MININRRRQKNRIGNLKWRLKNVFNLKSILRVLILTLLSVITIPVTLNFFIRKEYSDKIFFKGVDIPETRVAIVFGAGLANEGEDPSDILEDRINTAVELYNSGKVKKILMSGDNREIYHNEPEIMMEYARKLGVREFDLKADYKGVNTYETCYRAKEVYGINKAILITQEFHLPRSLYLCNTLGVDSIGFAADKSIYKDINYLKVREFLANLDAFWKLYINPSITEIEERESI
jgi:SanA protein